MMTKAAYFVRFLEVLAEKREEKRNERWLQRTKEGASRLLLFLIIVPSLSDPPGRKNFRCAESYPRGVGSTIMDGNRTTGRSRSFMSK